MAKSLFRIQIPLKKNSLGMVDKTILKESQEIASEGNPLKTVSNFSWKRKL